jgi:hypothetical protein
VASESITSMEKIPIKIKISIMSNLSRLRLFLLMENIHTSYIEKIITASNVIAEKLVKAV